MKVPNSSRKKALIVVDVQPSFLNERNYHIVKNLLSLLSTASYDLYVEATFHAEKGSMWEIQQDWTCPQGNGTQTVAEISKKLRELGSTQLLKTTKSAFKGDKDILSVLRDDGIEEVHVVGLDTNDCVLATALEAFDLGFVTYIIEECCQSGSSDELHEYALKILREQNMTNHSVV